jgi:nitroreductase
MDALTALHQRVSIARLTEPAPTQEQCHSLIKAALRAADHGNLQPWRFLFIQGEGLAQLGDLFARVGLAKNPSLSDAEIERFKTMPLRAPMIIVSIAVCQDHPKVPQVEQLLSAGAATQNLITAAYAMGLGAVWRTGDLAYDREIMTSLGLHQHEQIIGFIYIGTPSAAVGMPKTAPVEEFFSQWPSN